jgi:hypothetical protein
MVLEKKQKAPIMKLTEKVLDKKLLSDFIDIINNSELFFEIYDVETI